MRGKLLTLVTWFILVSSFIKPAKELSLQKRSLLNICNND